jgi:hypothetical protein
MESKNEVDLFAQSNGYYTLFGKRVVPGGSWYVATQPNGRHQRALVFLGADREDPDTYGSLFTVATVNLTEENLRPDEIAVKSWSENEGLYEWLLEKELIEEARRRVDIGHVEAPICPLTEYGLSFWEGHTKIENPNTESPNAEDSNE